MIFYGVCWCFLFFFVWCSIVFLGWCSMFVWVICVWFYHGFNSVCSAVWTICYTLGLTRGHLKWQCLIVLRFSKSKDFFLPGVWVCLTENLITHNLIKLGFTKNKKTWFTYYSILQWVFDLTQHVDPVLLFEASLQRLQWFVFEDWPLFLVQSPKETRHTNCGAKCFLRFSGPLS